MTKRPRSCAPAFGLLTAGLFLFTACHVVDTDDGDDSRRRCRAAGDMVVLVAAVEGRGGKGSGSGSSGSRSNGSDSGDRPGSRVDISKRDQAPARPPVGDHVWKEPRPAPRTTSPRRGHEAPTPTPAPSRTDRCKGAR